MICKYSQIKYFNLTKINIYYSQSLSLFFVRNSLGLLFLYLPSFYFVKQSSHRIIFLFEKAKFFKSFIKHLFILYDRLFNFYYIKIKMRGLGYRIREITQNFYYFFFNYTNYYYFHSPSNFFISVYKKRLLMVSLNWQSLKLVLSQILLLKTLGPYRLRGLRIPRQFVLLKKSGKTI